MTDNDQKTRQQANRLRLAEDLSAGVYQQYRGDEWHGPSAPDGRRSVCFGGRRLRNRPPLASYRPELAPRA